VRSEDGQPVWERKGFRTYLDLQAAAPALRDALLALHSEIDSACMDIAAALNRGPVEPLTASVDRLICALADAREALADHDEAGGSWPSDLGEPVRCGTLGAVLPTAPTPTGTLEWRDGRPVRPADGRTADVDRAGWVPLRDAGAICNRALPTMRAWVRHGRIKGMRENPDDPASRVLVELAAVLRVAAEMDHKTARHDAGPGPAPGCRIVRMVVASHIGRWLLSRGPDARPGDVATPESPTGRWSGLVVIDAGWSGAMSVVEGEAALRSDSGPRRFAAGADGLPAVLGVVAGSWTAELAARIPNGARVLIMAPFDRKGDECAAAIAATLVKKCQVRRWNP